MPREVSSAAALVSFAASSVLRGVNGGHSAQPFVPATCVKTAVVWRSLSAAAAYLSFTAKPKTA